LARPPIYADPRIVMVTRAREDRERSDEYLKLYEETLFR
jgi:hypothetical protein